MSRHEDIFLFIGLLSRLFLESSKTTKFPFYFPVPSAPPENVHVETLNETTAYVRWSPPPPQHFNGNLLGYKVSLHVIHLLS